MPKLYDKDTGAWLGTITEEQLQFLIDQLEEESSEDQDYYINEATLEIFEGAGADPALVTSFAPLWMAEKKWRFAGQVLECFSTLQSNSAFGSGRAAHLKLILTFS